MRIWNLLLLLSLIIITGCAPTPAFTPTATKTPDASFIQLSSEVPPTTAAAEVAAVTQPTIEPTLAVTPSETPTPTIDPLAATPTPTETPPPPTPDDGLPPDHYVVGRPLSSDYVDFGIRTYAYGSTSGGQYRPHTGLDFNNPEGTPILAVASGTIDYAGTDASVQYGPQLNFYGSLIVIRLDYTHNGQAVYALYGHLSAISVQTGQLVTTGQEIGAVGGTGVAAGGAHLHFEIRLGNSTNYSASTRNPDLWIKPYFGFGTLAGRITDASGNPMRLVSITIRSTEIPRYTWTYAGDENIPDPTWNENFTYGDLPEGWYTVSFVAGKTYTCDVYIRAGRTAWLEVQSGSEGC